MTTPEQLVAFVAVLVCVALVGRGKADLLAGPRALWLTAASSPLDSASVGN